MSPPADEILATEDLVARRKAHVCEMNVHRIDASPYAAQMVSERLRAMR